MEWERETWLEEFQAGETITEIARKHGISRKAVYKWIERYEAYGLEGLRDLSRAPHQHPNEVEEVWRERVRAARQEHPRWGARKLAWKLKGAYGTGSTPSPSTIGRLLKEMGLSRQRRSTVRANGTEMLWDAEEPNQVWAIDFKGWCRTGDGKRCEPLTITDHATRYLLCCQALESTRTELVRPILERVFHEYGLPERIRSDNGPPFGCNGGCGLTELAVWWIELGIEPERIRRGKPQQNGRHERMHRTLKEETMQHPAATLRKQQTRFDDFRQEYNEQRPHEALGLQLPATFYGPAVHPYPRRISPPEYDAQWTVRRVSNGGRANWHAHRVFISHALEGKDVGFEWVEEGLWRVWFHRHWLGMWEPRKSRLWRPIDWAKKQQRQRRTSL